MNAYAKRIWHARHFWIYLALSDVRARWRRSYFGILWAILQPLGLTLLLSIVFSKLMGRDFITYAPYVLSGILVWELANFSANSGAVAFVQAGPYIQQCRHPLAIYTLRIVVSGLIVFSIASINLIIWSIIVFPHNINLSWIVLPTIIPILAVILWPVITLTAYISVRFRDVPHLIGLLLLALWFVSPIYFEVSMFRRGGLNILIDYNPIYHVLQILRAPLLEGVFPTIKNYVFALSTGIIFGILAWLVGRKMEKKVIFYL